MFVSTYRSAQKVHGIKSDQIMENVKEGKVNKNQKVSKGYRLKISTHNKIKELQNLVKGSQDKIISSAIRHYSIKINQRDK